MTLKTFVREKKYVPWLRILDKLYRTSQWLMNQAYIQSCHNCLEEVVKNFAVNDTNTTFYNLTNWSWCFFIFRQKAEQEIRFELQDMLEAFFDSDHSDNKRFCVFEDT